MRNRAWLVACVMLVMTMRECSPVCTIADLQNELIDALECLATIAVISGMDVEEKIR